MRIVITGAQGLIGWHAHARLHAVNCAAQFKGEKAPFDIQALGHAEFDEDDALLKAISGADAVLHFAGMNRGPDSEIESTNPAIAKRLIEVCENAGVKPHLIYANSIHESTDTPYGRSKKRAGEVLKKLSSSYTDLILPHIFGEGAKPFYNNVTATLISQLIAGYEVEINPDGKLKLFHAGVAAQLAIDAVVDGRVGVVHPEYRDMSVAELFTKLQSFHDNDKLNIYPDITDQFDLALFNTYRSATYPDHWPHHLEKNSDSRGTLFEAVKGGGGGQTFLSTTNPGVSRGDHFHLSKVERFLVLRGEATIRMRRVLTDQVWEFKVSGDTPAPIDMPTLHTHSIENTGDGELLTLFWANEIFDPVHPDTFSDKVLP